VTFPGTDQAATARRLGYGAGPEAIAALNRDHDTDHLRLCRLLRRRSRCLAHAADGAPAHPTEHHAALGWEERLVLATRRWVNTGEPSPETDFLWWWGLDPAAVRRALERR
jgi:hypothetical protein